MNILIDPLLYLQFLRELSGGIFNDFFLACSLYGETVSVIILIALFYWCIDKKLGEYLLISFCWVGFVVSFLKNAVCMYRPWVLDPRVHTVKEALPGAGGYSLPSGHTGNVLTLFGGLVIRGKYSKLTNIILIVCLFLVCFSRMYLGAHTILDLISIIIPGIIVLILFGRIFDKIDEKPNLDIIISASGLIVMALITVYSLLKGYPIDYDSAGQIIVDPVKTTLGSFYCNGLATGLLIGWPIERRFVQFSHEGTIESKMVRFIVGFLGIGLISEVIVPLIGKETALQNFSGMFLLGLFVMLIYPAIIKIYQNRKN